MWKRTLLGLSLVVGSAAFAQPRRVAVPPPAQAPVVRTVRYEAPPRYVVVSPGVETVAGGNERIYHSGGVYYVQREGRWYRSSDYRRGWTPSPRVPGAVERYEVQRFHHGPERVEGRRGR